MQKENYMVTNWTTSVVRLIGHLIGLQTQFEKVSLMQPTTTHEGWRNTIFRVLKVKRVTSTTIPPNDTMSQTRRRGPPRGGEARRCTRTARRRDLERGRGRVEVAEVVAPLRVLPPSSGGRPTDGLGAPHASSFSSATVREDTDIVRPLDKVGVEETGDTWGLRSGGFSLNLRRDGTDDTTSSRGTISWDTSYGYGS